MRFFVIATCVIWCMAAAPSSQPATAPSDEVASLRKIITALQQQIRTLRAENERLRAIAKVGGKAEDPTADPSMYDAIKTPRANDGGIAMHDSTMRPYSPTDAYEKVANDMTVTEVIKIMGGWQNDKETDNVRTIEWIFVTDAGGELTISVRFRDGKCIGKSRNSRG